MIETTGATTTTGRSETRLATQGKQELDLETEIMKAEAEEHAYAMAKTSEQHYQLPLKRFTASRPQ